MEQLLKKKSVRLSGCALDKQEECPISGEYTLPEYCPDVAVVLKCFAYPRILNRQWSGDQLLVDGNAVIRVLYLDEGRRCVHSIEFVQPFTCSMRGDGRADNAAVNLELTTKYLNCRAISSRRVEVRGAATVSARADCVVQKELGSVAEDRALYTKAERKEISTPCAANEKVVTISESLDFPEVLPPAELLLGGECHAVMRECKLLNGKAIVKGQVFLHQLYLDVQEGVHCLDFTLPFSQILDIAEAMDGMPCNAVVHVLSDTERCVVGPSGENTILDVSVKLLVQVQVYHRDEVTVLKEAYHSRCPVTAQAENVNFCSFLGTRWEETVLPMQLTVQQGRWQEIVDVCIQPQECSTECIDGSAVVKGRMMVCVVARDMDGEVVYDEFVEDYTLPYVCQGNAIRISLVPIGCKYRVVENALELQVTLCAAVTDWQCDSESVLTDLRLQSDCPYPQQKVTAWLYYADVGENVWDIGRSCHTSPNCICEENGLVDDCVAESTVLIVPMMS